MSLYLKNKWLYWTSGLLGAFFSCAPTVEVIRMNEQVSVLPADCPLSFEAIDPDEAQNNYESLGTLSIAAEPTNQFSDGLKKILRPYACQLGGELVIPLGSAENWAENKASFLVLRKKVSEP